MSTYILLIEDNPGDAVIFREKLNASDLDYKLATAKRLSEGLDRIEETDFDIILVDLSLPDTQGLEAVSKVREAAPDRPLIVLTGLDDATAAAEAKKLGAVDYLVKWYVDSVSLSRYIRYAIAQYHMFGGGDGDTPPNRPQRPRAVPQRVVEGNVPGEGQGATGAAPKPTAEAPPPERVATERVVPEPEAVGAREQGSDLRRALVGAEAALLIVNADGAVVFASEAARAWVPDDHYPWPLEAGTRRVTREVGQGLEQEASPTEWGGSGAYVVTLREPASSAPSPAPDGELMLQASEAALGYVDRIAHQSQWMAGVLRSALDLRRVVSGEIELQPADIDVLEIAQQVTREERSVAMTYGIPLRTTSDRKKAIAYADRNVVYTLLHRLVVDAVHVAAADGVEVTVEVERRHTAVAVTWVESSRAVDPAVEACLTLGREVVRHIAAITDGESRHERNPSGDHVFTVRLPCRTADCDA